MPTSPREVLSVVERGWRGARECSLSLDAMAVQVTHLIKGSLSGELRAMIRPLPHVRIVSVPRTVFRIRLWGTLVWRTAMGRLRWLLSDHERTLREVSWWCRRFGVMLVSIHETEHGYELWVDGQAMPFASVFPSG